MLRRALFATVLLVIGVPMVGSVETAPLGVLLLLVGVAVFALPTYLRRTRSG